MNEWMNFTFSSAFISKPRNIIFTPPIPTTIIPFPMVSFTSPKIVALPVPFNFWEIEMIMLNEIWIGSQNCVNHNTYKTLNVRPWSGGSNIIQTQSWTKTVIIWRCETNAKTNRLHKATICMHHTDQKVKWNTPIHDIRIHTDT